MRHVKHIQKIAQGLKIRDLSVPRSLRSRPLPSEDRALLLLEDIVSDKTANIKNFITSGRELLALYLLLCDMPPVGGFLKKNPAYIRRAVRAAFHSTEVIEEAIRDITSLKVCCEDETEFMRRLRVLRASATAAVVAADAWRKRSISKVTYLLSKIADASVRAAVSRACRGENFLGVMGLGKLGGRELNLSSDIDLIFVRCSGDLQRTEEAAAKTALLLSTPLGDGWEWRVDLRLRPDGTASPLAPSLERFREYALKTARPWERAAMIKARWIAGPTSTWQELGGELRKFVYRPYLDFSIISDMVEMRSSISGSDDDLKTGSGGIRDVELVVQCHQLIYGGIVSKLRRARTTDAVSALALCGLMKEEYSKGLKRAYLFLRRAEHAIMCESIRQTHRLPKDAEKIADLAARCGLNLEKFNTELETQRSNVIDRVLETLSLSGDKNFSTQSNETLDIDDKILVRWNSFDPSILFKRGGKRAEKAYKMLEPKLLGAISNSENKDLVLSRAYDFLKNVRAKETVFTMLSARPDVMSVLVDLFDSSEMLSRVMIRTPPLIERLALPVSDEDRAWKATLSSLKKIGKSAAGMEEKMERARRAAGEAMLTVALLDLSGRISGTEVERRITDLAEAAVTCALQTAVAEASLHAAPRNRTECRRALEAGIAVLGMGAVAAREMTYSSDIDLVFVVNPEPLKKFFGQKSHEILIKTAQKIITFLSSPTSYGRVFAVDTRLRPSGSQGQLICSISSFLEYHMHRSAPWERMALLRSRPVAGGEAICCDLAGAIDTILTVPTENRELIESARGMRERQMQLYNKQSRMFDIKFGAGGIYDILFCVQILQLLHIKNNPSLKTPNCLQALHNLAKCGYMDSVRAELLSDAMRFYMRLGALWKLKTNRPDTEVDILSLSPRFLALLKESIPQGMRDKDLKSVVMFFRKGVENTFNAVLKEVEGEHKI